MAPAEQGYFYQPQNCSASDEQVEHSLSSQKAQTLQENEPTEHLSPLQQHSEP